MPTEFVRPGAAAVEALTLWRGMLQKVDDVFALPQLGPDLESGVRGAFIQGGIIADSRAGVRKFAHDFKADKPKAVAFARRLSGLMLKVVDTYLTGEDHVDPYTGLSTSAMIADAQRDRANDTRIDSPVRIPTTGDDMPSMLAHSASARDCGAAICNALYRLTYGKDIPTMQHNGRHALSPNVRYNPASYGLIFAYDVILKSNHNLMLSTMPEEGRKFVIGSLILGDMANVSDLQAGYLSPCLPILMTPPTGTAPHKPDKPN